MQDEDDEDKYEFNINSGDFVKQDKVFMQAANFVYNMIDSQVGMEVGELNLGKDFELLKNWGIIESNDSGDGIDNSKDSSFGVVALQHGEDIIIAFEGSRPLWLNEGAWHDWIKTDALVVALGQNSKQVYEAYKFVHKAQAYRTGDQNIYIAGHSLGGWLSQKVGGSLLNPSINLTEKTAYGDKYYKKNQLPKSIKIKVKLKK